MLDNNGKKYLSDMFHYVGVGFIGGSISHGFFSGERSVIMAIIGFVLFLIGELIQKQSLKDVNYLKILFVGVIYSLSIGMVNGGLQHFLDSPERSLWIIPLGFFISLLIYPLKENITFKEIRKNLLFLSSFSLLISGSIILAYVFIPKDFYGVEDHHNDEKVHNEQNVKIENNIVGDDVIEQKNHEIVVENELPVKDTHLDDGHED